MYTHVCIYFYSRIINVSGYFLLFFFLAFLLPVLSHTHSLSLNIYRYLYTCLCIHVCSHTYMYLRVCICTHIGGARDVMVIVVGKGLGDASSNPGRD